MFNFLKKKRVDDSKVDDFVSWFVSIEADLINSFSEGEHTKYLDAVEEKLMTVYSDGFSGSPEFEFGISPDMSGFEFNIYHLNNKFLKEATAKIQAKLKLLVSDKWTINIGE